MAAHHPNRGLLQFNEKPVNAFILIVKAAFNSCNYYLVLIDTLSNCSTLFRVHPCKLGLVAEK